MSSRSPLSFEASSDLLSSWSDKDEAGLILWPKRSKKVMGGSASGIALASFASAAPPLPSLELRIEPEDASATACDSAAAEEEEEASALKLLEEDELVED